MKAPRRQIQLPESSGDEEFDAESTEDPGYKPETVDRRCTDVLWCAALLLTVVGNAFVGLQAMPVQTQIFRFTHLRDHLGHACGVRDLWNREMLYFCECPFTTLGLSNAICVQSCPTNSSTATLCPCSTATFEYGNDKTGQYMMDYPTTVFMGMVCRPTDSLRLASIKKWFEQTAAVANIAMICRTWLALVLSAFVAIVTSMLFIGFLNRYAETLVWGGIGLIVSILIGSASYLLMFCVHLGQCAGDTRREFFAFSMVLLAIGLGTWRFACTARHDISLSIECITWASNFIMNAKSLALIPFLTLTARLAVCIGMTTTFRAIVAVTNLDLIVKKSMTKGQVLATGVTFVLFLWLQLIISAASDFVTTHATAVWYFRGGMDLPSAAPKCLALRSVWVACRYHAGTLIGGAILIGALTPFRVLGRSVIFSCDLPSSSLYCEVARCSSPLWTAWHAMARLTEEEEDEGNATAILNGATRIFKLVGLALCAVLGYVATFAYTECFPEFRDMSSPHFLPNPLIMQSAGAVAALICSMPYMNLFDTISDTILYCHSIETRWAARDEEADQALKNAELAKSWSDRVFHMAKDFGCYCGYRSKEQGNIPTPMQLRGRPVAHTAEDRDSTPEADVDGPWVAWDEAGATPRRDDAAYVPDATQVAWQQVTNGRGVYSPRGQFAHNPY